MSKKRDKDRGNKRHCRMNYIRFLKYLRRINRLLSPSDYDGDNLQGPVK